MKKLTRKQLREIIGGDAPNEGAGCSSSCIGSCTYTCQGTTYDDGHCRANPSGVCMCSGVC